MDDVVDPQGRRWQRIQWSAWVTLEAAIRLAPDHPGLYRIRSPDLAGLIYVGETGRALNGRLRDLRQAIKKAPGKTKGDPPPHVAGYCVWQHLHAGHTIELSWAPVPDLDKRERKGTECDLIAAHRKALGRSPTCQFGGIYEK